jgi:hypothetical protein
MHGFKRQIRRIERSNLSQIPVPVNQPPLVWGSHRPFVVIPRMIRRGCHAAGGPDRPAARRSAFRRKNASWTLRPRVKQTAGPRPDRTNVAAGVRYRGVRARRGSRIAISGRRPPRPDRPATRPEARD